MSRERMVQVRCPKCHKLAAEVSEGAAARVKCSRCAFLYERTGTGPDASAPDEVRRERP
jgi:phage FluMu protein Com